MEKTVELNAMWYNANMIMMDLTRKMGHFIKQINIKNLLKIVNFHLI